MLPGEPQKSKYLSPDFWRPLIVPAIVVLVGLSAFALGRLSTIGGAATSGASTALNQ
jgi:hypothetical protein